MNKDQHIYQQMLKAIVEHQLKPGMRLPEDKLAETFDISRTGIRKVLQRLALEQFVTIQPNRGAHVSKPSVEEARQVLDSRIMVEPLLLEKVVAGWNMQTKELIASILEQEHEADHAQDLGGMIDLTARFHIEIARASGNQVMADFVKQLSLRSSLVVAVYGSRHSVGCDCGSHGELIELIEGGRVAQSMQWMQRHLEVIRDSLELSASPEVSDFQKIFSEVN